jgi:hypothetical protein
MKKLNETSSAQINVLGEGELEQVVGGYCHKKRWGHCGGWYKPRYNHCKKYEYSYEPEYKEESSDYESSEYSETSESGGNVQIANVAVTVNIAQVQG